MTTILFDAVFAFNYRRHEGCHEWDNVPNDLWRKLISSSITLGIDAVGLQDIHSTADLRRIGPFRELSISQVGIGRYRPYHGKSANEIALFQLNSDVLKAFLAESFDQWNKVNEEMAVDEIIFFSHTKPRIVAVPYENLIFIYDLNQDEFNALCQIDPVFRSCLLKCDMSGQLDGQIN